jgi:hypothetical protein
MGIYYSHCLIPKDNTIRPAPERVAALIEAWIEKRFVVGPESLPAWMRHQPNVENRRVLQDGTSV